MAKPVITSEVRISAGNNYIELLALHAEVLGMQAENQRCKACGNSIAYGEDAFMNIANQMRALKEASDEDNA